MINWTFRNSACEAESLLRLSSQHSKFPARNAYCGKTDIRSEKDLYTAYKVSKKVNESFGLVGAIVKLLASWKLQQEFEAFPPQRKTVRT